MRILLQYIGNKFTTSRNNVHSGYAKPRIGEKAYTRGVSPVNAPRTHATFQREMWIWGSSQTDDSQHKGTTGTPSEARGLDTMQQREHHNSIPRATLRERRMRPVPPLRLTAQILVTATTTFSRSIPGLRIRPRALRQEKKIQLRRRKDAVFL